MTDEEDEKKLPRKPWDATEVEVLRQRYPDENTAILAEALGVQIAQVHRKARLLGIRKSPQFMSGLRTLDAARITETGKSTRKRPGDVPWNKGGSFVAGGRSPETRFQKGSKPHNHAALGSTRNSKGGYLLRKMTDTGYQPRDWVPEHHIIWEAAGKGAVPPGHALCFLDGNLRNFAIDNLELVSRRDLMLRNSIHNYGPEISVVSQLLGAVRRQINQQEGKI